jgi:protein TonB
MVMQRTLTPEVFTAREIARAAGATAADAEALLASGLVTTRDAAFVDAAEAVRAVLLLQGRRTGPGEPRPLFGPLRHGTRRRALPLTASTALHGTAFVIAIFATFGASSHEASRPAADPTRLVFLVAPGPGGGGGGGGLRQPAPVRRARLEGKSALKSPIPVERAVRKPEPEPPRPKPLPPPQVQPAPAPAEPPPPVAKPEPVPPVVAPVASGAADKRDRTGDLGAVKEERPQDHAGPGNGGGAGTGSGTGMGAGTGAGIGDGSGAGTGGGPYRPGSGIEAPEILREVKPDYTEEARRRSLSGDVVLEIVVRADGRVGAVKIVRGLGAGLDQRAVDAVRQWLFKPARRFGTPVDVVVEIAVEFRLR